MVRPERVCRIRAIGLQKDKEWFISAIHKFGCLHIDNVPEKIKSSKVYEELQPDKPLEEVERVSELLMRTNFLIDVFEQVEPVQGSVRVLPAEFTLSGVINEAKAELALFETAVVDAYEAMKGLDERIDENKRARQLLARFNVDFDVKKVSETREVKLAYGRVLKKDFDAFEFSKEFKKNAVVLINDESKIAYTVFIAYHEVHEDIVFSALKQLNVEREKAELPSKTVAELDTELEDLNKVREELVDNLRVLAQKHAIEVQYLQRLLTAAKERAEISTHFGKTNKTFCIEAYVPVKNEKQLEKLLENKNIILEKEKPDDAPVLLQNPPYVKSFERITSMFGLPMYNAVDPTLFVSLFFPFFFGFMLSDVGYGAMVLIAATAFLLMRKRHEAFKDIGVIALACGISTVIFGMLFGSFFGTLITIPAIWVDPFKDSMAILTVAIGVGILHANLGILLSSITHIRNGDWKKLIVENVSLLSLQLAAVFFYLGQPMMGGSLVLLSAILLVVKSSLFGVMEISGFVGLILSYARILALSLATGGIALAVNIMAEQMLGLGWIGVIFATIFILGGHLFNFVLNIIGSTVNAARLHFVEFFSLFFIEGGKKFIPFKLKQE